MIGFWCRFRRLKIISFVTGNWRCFVPNIEWGITLTGLQCCSFFYCKFCALLVFVFTCTAAKGKVWHLGRIVIIDHRHHWLITMYRTLSWSAKFFLEILTIPLQILTSISLISCRMCKDKIMTVIGLSSMNCPPLMNWTPQINPCYYKGKQKQLKKQKQVLWYLWVSTFTVIGQFSCQYSIVRPTFFKAVLVAKCFLIYRQAFLTFIATNFLLLLLCWWFMSHLTIISNFPFNVHQKLEAILDESLHKFIHYSKYNCKK